MKCLFLSYNTYYMHYLAIKCIKIVAANSYTDLILISKLQLDFSQNYMYAS